MKRILRSKAFVYEFDHRHKPALRVAPGESFIIETEDACSGVTRSVPTSDAAEKVGQRSSSTKSEFSFLVFDSFFSLPAPIQEVGYSDDQSHPG